MKPQKSTQANADKALTCLKKILSTRLSICGLALLGFRAIASTYYVDFENGSDLSVGSTPSSPWQHCPGDSLASGIPAKFTLNPGDVVIFKGGVRYQSTITINQSGTPANPLTFDGNSGGSFGVGRAVFDGGSVDSNTRRYGFTAATRYLSPLTVTNIVINNCEFQFFGGHNTGNPTNITWTCGNLPRSVDGYGILMNQVANWTIENCYFHDLGDFTNAPNMDAALASGHGISVAGCGSSITITNCEFTRIGHSAIQILTQYTNFTCTNISIINNNLHDYIQWGIELVPSADNSVMNDIRIDGNRIHDLYQYSANGYLGCAGNWPHTDGIFMFLGYSPPVTNCVLGTTQQPIVVRNNSFYNNISYTNQGGTACIFVSGFGGRVLIYNNTFANVLNMGEGSVYLLGAYDLITNHCTLNDYEVYNNTFFDQTFGVFLGSYSQAKALTNGTVKILNNSLYHTAVANFGLPIVFGADAWSAPTALDYNRYYTIRADGIIGTSWGGAVTAYNTFTQLRSLGYEVHGSYGDPKYGSITAGLGLATSQNDLHLQSTSPLIGAGVNLSSVFTTDKDGNQRPATGAWDIGAFEYSSSSASSSRPTAPSGFRVIGAGF